MLKPRCLLLNRWFSLFLVGINACRAPSWNPLQDSRRFEGIDADFKELANAMHETPNVVEATNKPGLFRKLEDIQSRWKFSQDQRFSVSSPYVSHKHTHTYWLCMCCAISTGFLCVKRLWQNTWTPSVWPFPDFTSSLQLICWTSCLMGPTHTRWFHKFMPKGWQWI